MFFLLMLWNNYLNWKKRKKKVWGSLTKNSVFESLLVKWVLVATAGHSHRVQRGLVHLSSDGEVAHPLEHSVEVFGGFSWGKRCTRHVDIVHTQITRGQHQAMLSSEHDLCKISAFHSVWPARSPKRFNDISEVWRVKGVGAIFQVAVFC